MFFETGPVRNVCKVGGTWTLVIELGASMRRRGDEKQSITPERVSHARRQDRRSREGKHSNLLDCCTSLTTRCMQT